jgi:hypothetical protein
MDACKDFVQTDVGEPGSPNIIINGDESWCFQLDPGTKRQREEWRKHNTPRPKYHASKSC